MGRLAQTLGFNYQLLLFMEVFICHASEDQDVAERIQLALIGAGFTVFFDSQSLPPGADYQNQIRAAINRSDIFIFLITTKSVMNGKFTLTELSLARKKWPHPAGHVLGVNLDNISVKSIPNYLLASSMLSIVGDAPAEVRSAIEQLRSSNSFGKFGRGNRKKRYWIGTLASVILIIAFSAWRFVSPQTEVRFDYGAGYFVQTGEVWVEYKYPERTQFATFREYSRDSRFIYLVDSHRLINGQMHTVYVEIPILGGMSRYSVDNLQNWNNIGIVKTME